MRKKKISISSKPSHLEPASVPRAKSEHSSTGRPFLWAVRPDLTNGRNGAYPMGFRERVAAQGIIMDWSTQQKSYICDVWEIGLRMDPDDTGMIFKEQVKEKVEKLSGDENMKMRSQRWKEMANKSVEEGGSSYKNINSIVSAMKTANLL